MQAGKYPQSQHSEDGRESKVQGLLGEVKASLCYKRPCLKRKKRVILVARAFQLVLQNLLPIVSLKCWDYRQLITTASSWISSMHPEDEIQA